MGITFLFGNLKDIFSTQRDGYHWSWELSSRRSWSRDFRRKHEDKQNVFCPICSSEIHGMLKMQKFQTFCKTMLALDAESQFKNYTELLNIWVKSFYSWKGYRKKINFILLSMILIYFVSILNFTNYFFYAT